MTYTAYVCETVTGRNMGPLDCQIVNWSRELNGTDTAQVALYPSTSKGGLSLANRDWLRLITQGPRMSLVIEWNTGPASTGSIMFAGPIWQRPWDGTKVTLSASGIRSLFTRRKALQWTLPYASQALNYSNQSLGSTGVSLVRDVAMAGSKAGSSLPIVFPAAEVDTDPTHVRTYYGYSLTNIDQCLTDLTNSVNGPDFDFTPSWTDASRSHLQYTMRAGTNEQPKIMQAATISFDATQPKSSVQLLTYLDDASMMATTDWALGAGDGTGALMSIAQSTTLTSNGWPLLEQETDYKSVLDQPTLDAHTAGDLATFGAPAVQFGLKVDITKAPTFGPYTIGDNALVAVRNSFWIPDSPPAGYAMRIVKLSGDSTTTASMDVQSA